MMKYLIHILFISTIISCGQKKQTAPVIVNMSKFDDPLINVNKQISKEEKVKIDAFVLRNGYPMTESGTGVQYYIYEEKDKNAPHAESKDIVLIDFDIKLLDGTKCYSSKKTGAEEFVVDYDNVESGMHEAIKYLKKGDKAIIIIPSHLAFGLAGDNAEIPPLSSVVYDIELLDIYKNSKIKK